MEQAVREELLHNLLEGGQCRDLIRMSENAFRRLCEILQTVGGLRRTQRMSVEEHVARFLHIVSNDLRTRFTSWMYRRSRSTTSRCFHRVLRSIIAIEGAIDGTHVRVHVPNRDAPRYRGRKGYPTINVLAACTFDLKFTYVLTGWEGTASDSRIIKNTFTRDDKLLIPSGRYCLVDGGLPHTNKLMAPYRGVRYHLKEYSMRGPQNSKELFNLRHASLRNAIERAFGVLKRRFPIIRSTTEPFYSCETQSAIFLACCILHNFLLDEDRGTNLEDEVMQEILNEPQEQDRRNSTETDEDNSRADQLRNSIANEMGISLSGFAWNSTTQLIEAEEEVWDNLINSKPEAALLRTKKIANFDDMLILCARDRASGAHAETAKERNDRLNKNVKIQVETIKEVDDLLANNEIHLENEYVDLDDDIQGVIPTPFSQGQSSGAKKCKSKKRKFEEEDEEEEDFNSKIMKSVDNVAGAIREGNVIFDKAYPREYTGDEIYRELELVGLEPHELPRALNFLAANQAKARTLFSCPLQIRMGVLKDMMGARSFHVDYTPKKQTQLNVWFHSVPSIIMRTQVHSRFVPSPSIINLMQIHVDERYECEPRKNELRSFAGVTLHSSYHTSDYKD
uniref:DDE Tnp4 domain-containing protein n=1 Tax=Lactuca sativa TaxID=4236 RepID=A0A9R1WJL4_LACSA|nr:hypothetical protein LSAT_V11C200081900 [Lactuca sativa]